jgi:choline dehydrogenase-like flavoprotein
VTADVMRRFSDDEVVDVVVVGTGAGGAPLLATLAARGLRVVALEAGSDSDPAAHTPDEIEATDIIWMDERLSGGETPTAFGPNNSGRGVGGSMLHWGAFCPRPDPRDLRLRSDTGMGRDWPLTYDELLPYLERVEADIGVSGPPDYPWDPTRRYAYPPVGRNGSADAMLRGCAALGIRATDAPAAVLSADRDQPHWGLRHACANCGACHQGCRNAAKAGTDTTYLPAAVAAGAEIRPDAVVHGVELDGRGRISAVVYRRDGIDHRQRCATLVLAAGGIETPRLLLHWGLANGSGQVGRSFLAHGATQVWGTLDTDVRAYRGYPSAAITEDMLRPADADFAGGYLVQSLGVMPLTWATGLVRGAGLWGRALMDALEGYPRSVGVGINAECLPNRDSRLSLADDTDALGVPLVTVSLSPGANEQAMDAHAVGTMTAILQAAGARDLRTVARTAHTLGTAPMGEDPDASVVDPWGRSHEVENLWVCDGSVFPSSLPANPALTIMALSLRTAGRLIDG